MQRLDDLLLFAEVVERKGFAAAARSLALQRSKVSRRIGELEQRMGIRLLQRNTRRVSLTSAGEQVYVHARAIAQEARAAFNTAAELHGEPRGLLRLTCPLPFATHILTQLVAEFSQLHPQLRVLVDASDRNVDLVAEAFDLAFRAHQAPLDDSSLIATPIGAVPMSIVLAPHLMPSRASLSHPDQLLKYGLLAHSLRDGNNALRFLRGAKRQHILRFTPRLISGSFDVLRAAAIAGMGAVCLPRYLCRAAVMSGQLVNAFGGESGWHVAPSQIHALIPARRGVTLATRLFLDFSLARLATAVRGEDHAQSAAQRSATRRSPRCPA